MQRLLLIGCILIATGSLATAKPSKLADHQLGQVAAGLIPVDPPPVNGHPWHPGEPTGWHPPIINPVGPPILNPGGPILISCQIGSGCTTTHIH